MSSLTATKSLGNAGESFVVNHLQQHGFTICAQNYRKFFGEIDIIAYKKQLYVFVEVKTRKPTTVAMGQLISKSKQKKIIKTAQTFIAEKQLFNKTFRFDVALLVKNDVNFSIDYLENAFTQQEDGYDYY
ncbi:MAG: YraN family protein [Candidatus Dependentiae bacterium]|nr:YraN family protein [Candidatus Dependentiae bacterium]